MQAPDFGKIQIQRSGTNIGLRGNELKAAGQLLPEQPGRRAAVLMPPESGLSNLPLRLSGDDQPKPQSSVLELSEEVPAVDDLATVGLSHRFTEERSLFSGEREALFSLRNQKSDRISFLKAAFRHIQPSAVHNSCGKNFHEVILPPAAGTFARGTKTGLLRRREADEPQVTRPG